MPESRGLATLLENSFNQLVPQSPAEGAAMLAGGPLLGKIAGPVSAKAFSKMGIPDLAEESLRRVLPKLEASFARIKNKHVLRARSENRPLNQAEVRGVAREFVEGMENRLVNETKDPTFQLRLNAETLGIPEASLPDLRRAVHEIRNNRITNMNAVNRMNPSLVDDGGNLLNRLPEGPSRLGGRGGPGSPTPTQDTLNARIAARKARIAAQRAAKAAARKHKKTPK